MYSCIHRYYPAFILIVLELFPFPFFPSHGVCLYCACAGLLLAAQCFRRTTVLFRRARPRGMHKCWNGGEEEEEEEEEEEDEAVVNFLFPRITLAGLGAPMPAQEPHPSAVEDDEEIERPDALTLPFFPSVSRTFSSENSAAISFIGTAENARATNSS